MRKEITERELASLIKQFNLDEMPEEPSDVPTFEAEGDNVLEKGGTSRDGWIQVKDQAIIVEDPIGKGKPPVIGCLPPVRLIVNDKVVKTRCAVSSKDQIRWEIVEEPLFEISVTKDKMKAYFHLKSRDRYAWQLVETEPINELQIRAEQNKNYVLETVRLNEVLKVIREKSIQANLDISAVQLELYQPTYRPVLFASGKKAVPGKDAKLDVYFSEKIESRLVEESGRVDFRNHLQIPTVNSGDLIAKKIPLTEGIPGYDVYGNAIQPAAPKDILVVAKPSVQITPDGEIIALQNGRPRMTGHKVRIFDIVSAYVVTGDVNIETGNIVFSGDVIVYGNVMDNMIIESIGNVYIYGSVYNSTITATGSIHVKGNVLGSKLYSGYFGVLFNRLYQASKKLEELVAKLLAASNMLEKILESKKQLTRYNRIVMLLIEHKFQDIPKVAKELLEVLANIQRIKKDDYQKLGEMSSVFLKPATIFETAGVNFLHSYQLLLQETQQEVARMQEVNTEVRLNQSHKSVIKSNGDIVVLRDGVISSELYATKHILFRHDAAVCRGSRLEAGGSIEAKVVGGTTGANTVLKAKVKVAVRKMFGGRVCVGRHCIDIDSVIEGKTFLFHDLIKTLIK